MEKLGEVLLIINSLSIGGAERLVLDIAKSNPKKYDVLVLKDNPSFIKQSLVEANVNYKFLTSGSVYNPLLIFKLIKFLRSYNVVHIHLFPTLYWVVLAKILSFSDVKLVLTEHNTHNRRRENAFFKIIDRYIYKKLNFVIAISNGTENNLRKHLGLKNINIKTITNGIDLNVFKFNNAQIDDLKIFNKEDFVIVQVSSFTEQKDHKTLIDSLDYLPENIKLILVGDGPLRFYYQSYVKEKNFTDRVKFLGIRKDIPSVLNYSKISILSSHFEGFGLVAVEAMAMGKPVVASNVSGLSDVVSEAGLLFEPRNSKDLSNKILELYEDGEYYQYVANRCLGRSKDYDILSMIEKYENVYSKLNML